MHEPTCVSLFSGVGGLDEGLRRAGFRHLLMCEQDAYRRDVLRARFPGVQVRTDVRNVWIGHRARAVREPAWGAPPDRRGAPTHDGRRQARTRVPLRVDLLAGGTPCQDLSVAGNRKGLAGDRSGLFFEYARVIDAFRPGWVLWENVPGAFSSNGGRDFGVVLGTLVDLGYGVGWRILDSRFFGVPQRRRRVFIVGARADGDPRAAAERAGEVLAVGSRCGRHSATRGEAREDVAGTLGGGSGSRGWAQDTERMTFVANTLKGHNGKGGSVFSPEDKFVVAPLTSGGHPNSNMPGRHKEDDENLFRPNIGPESPALKKEQTVAVQDGAMVRRLMPVECERLQAFPDNWTDLGGTADSKRYAALGDAVTVSVAEWIGRRLLAHVRQREAA